MVQVNFARCCIDALYLPGMGARRAGDVLIVAATA